MENIGLFSPELRATLGPYTLGRGTGMEVSSSRGSYSDWAKIQLPERLAVQLPLNRLDRAAVTVDYGDGPQEIFSGYVASPTGIYRAGGAVMLEDPALLLKEAQVSGTFLDCGPQEAVEHILRQAGIDHMRLSGRDYPRTRGFTLRRMSALQALETVNAVWGICPAFFFQQGVFYWDETPTQEKVYTFSYGLNILSLHNTAGVWEMTVPAAPFVRHSQIIRVEHPKKAGEVQILKTVTRTEAEGQARTTLYFK